MGAAALLWCAGAAQAGWEFDHQVGGEGRVFVVRTVAGTGTTSRSSWAATRDGLVSYTLEEGLVKVIGGVPGTRGGVAEPLCAACTSDRIWVADGADGRVLSFSDVVGYDTFIRVASQDPAHTPLVRDMACQSGMLVLACYDFTTHQATVRQVNREGRVLVEYGPSASSPGRWDWIFAVHPLGDDLLIYAYEGDGRNGRSWVEQRGPQGQERRAYLERPERDTAPLWFAARDLLVRAGQSFSFVLGPGSDGAGDSLMKVGSGGQVLVERADLRSEVGEPYLRLEYFDRAPCVWGMWPETDEPGRAYLLAEDLSFSAAHRQTPGPAAAFHAPQGVARISGDRVAVADTGNCRCLVLTVNGTPLAITPLPARPGPLVELPDGRLVAVNLDQAGSPAHGGLFVIAATGEIAGEWGVWGTGATGLAGPSDVAVGPDGNLYVADTLNHRVQVLNASGGPVRRWGGPSVGPWPQYRPHAIAVGEGLVVTAQEAEEGRDRLEYFDLEGRVLRESSVEERVTALAIAPGGQVLAATAGGRILRYDELGRAVEVTAPPVGSVGQMDRPGDLHLVGEELYVADTGHSRVAVLRPAAPAATIERHGPELLPARDGVRVTLEGTGLPGDLAAWLVLGSARHEARVWLLDPGLARLGFDLAQAVSGRYELWVAGTGLPEQVVGSVEVSVRLDLAVVGAWRLVKAGPSDALVACDGKTLLTLGVDGGVRWERLDGGQQCRRGWLVLDGTRLTLAYTDASLGVAATSEGYWYKLVGGSLELTGQPPSAPAEVLVFDPVGTGGLIEPDLSGVWRMTWTQEGGVRRRATWQEYLRVDEAGAYTQEGNRTGEWRGELGRLEAHDGVFTQAQQSWRGEGTVGLRRGAYVLEGNGLELRLAEPEVATTWWEREKQPGERPLLWGRLGVSGCLWRGRACTGTVYVGNHGQVAAEEVSVSVSLPWVEGGAEQAVGHVEALAPGASTALAVQIEPPAGYAAEEAGVTAVVRAQAPEEAEVHCSARLPVRTAALDLGVATACPGLAVRKEDVFLRITVFSRGLDPAEVIPAECGEEPAVIVEAPEYTTIDSVAGTWDAQARCLWFPWKRLMGAMATSPGVLDAWIRISGSVPVGRRLVSRIRLRMPEGVTDETPADDSSGWVIQIVPQHAELHLAVQPPFGLAGGKLLTLCARVSNPLQQYIEHQATLVDVDPWMDLASALPGEDASLDLAAHRVVFARSRSVPPGRSIVLSQAVRVSPAVPGDASLYFRAWALVPVLGCVESNVVVLGGRGRLGDLDGDGLVTAADVEAFAEGYRAAREGRYEAAYDLAPLEGAWPDPVSAPDGVVDWRDAATMVEAWLGGGDY